MSFIFFITPGENTREKTPSGFRLCVYGQNRSSSSFWISKFMERLETKTHCGAPQRDIPRTWDLLFENLVGYFKNNPNPVFETGNMQRRITQRFSTEHT